LTSNFGDLKITCNAGTSVQNIAALMQVSHKQREFEYEIVLQALKEENPLEEK
jgi:hypothetical protein